MQLYVTSYFSFLPVASTILPALFIDLSKMQLIQKVGMLPTSKILAFATVWKEMTVSKCFIKRVKLVGFWVFFFTTTLIPSSNLLNRIMLTWSTSHFWDSLLALMVILILHYKWFILVKKLCNLLGLLLAETIEWMLICM